MNKTFHATPVATRLALAAALALAVVGAGTAIAAGAPAAAGSKSAALSKVGAMLPLAQFGPGDTTPLAVAARAGVLASLLAGTDVPAAAPDVTARVLALSPEGAEFVVRSANGAKLLAEAPARAIGVQPVEQVGTDEEVAARARAAALAAGGDPAERIRVMLDLGSNEALAIHGALADDYSSVADVGAAQARVTFDAVVQRLQASATAPGALDLQDVGTARLMQAERAVDGPVTTRVKAYLFEVPMALGSIPVFGAETLVAVHRSGQVASIRMTGPAVRPAPRGAAIRRAVAAESLERRAQADHPGAVVTSLGLRYPWQATQDAALASRPRQAFQVQPMAQVDGATVKGRLHYVFYSVESERAAPLVWPTPQPAATGDKR